MMQLLLAVLLASDAAPKGVSLHPWPEDVPRKAELESTGVARIAEHVVAWFPKSALDDAAMSAIVSRLDRGVASAKKAIGKPDWNHAGDRRVFLYFPDARFVAHAPGGNTAFVPLWRIKADEAPWLHESLHLLLASSDGDWLERADANEKMPLWLSEGLPDSIAIHVSETEGLRYSSPLWTVAPSGIDGFCRTQLATPAGEKALAFVGSPGKMRDLFGPDRVAYAQPFYACSASFVRFLAKKKGFTPLLDAIAAFGREHETLERQLGQPLADLKKAWLASIVAAR